MARNKGRDIQKIIEQIEAGIYIPLPENGPVL